MASRSLGLIYRWDKEWKSHRAHNIPCKKHPVWGWQAFSAKLHISVAASHLSHCCPKAAQVIHKGVSVAVFQWDFTYPTRQRPLLPSGCGFATPGITVSRSNHIHITESRQTCTRRGDADGHRGALSINSSNTGLSGSRSAGKPGWRRCLGLVWSNAASEKAAMLLVRASWRPMSRGER